MRPWGGFPGLRAERRQVSGSAVVGVHRQVEVGGGVMGGKAWGDRRKSWGLAMSLTCKGGAGGATGLQVTQSLN